MVHPTQKMTQNMYEFVKVAAENTYTFKVDMKFLFHRIESSGKLAERN